MAGSLLLTSCLAAPAIAGEALSAEPPRHDPAARQARIEAHAREQAAARGKSLASAQSVQCGEVVTEDLVLARDLACGFSVASGVTVDLGGHTVHGAIVACLGAAQCGFGDGEDVTIRNGTVEGPIVYESCERCVLDRVTVRGVDDFFAVELGTDNVVIRSHFLDNDAALSSYFGSGRNVVALSTFEDNGVGVVIGGNDDNLVWGNRFSGNGSGVIVFDEDDVVASDNRVIRNFFADNGVGAVLHARTEAERNLFARNVFWGNRGPGLLLRARCVFGAPACGGRGSRAVQNLLLANGSEPLEIRYDYEDEEISETRSVLVDDGISAPTHDDVRGNAGLLLTGNRALLNRDLGIDAPGVVDGGRNLGALNGDRRQCVGVRCRRR